MQADFIVKIPGYEVEYSAALPDEFKDHYLPGSELITVVGIFGKMSVQKLRLNDYRIYAALLALEQDVTVYLSYPEPLCFSQIVLHGSYLATLRGIGEIAFKQHRFSLLYCSRWNARCFFSKGDYVLLLLGYPAAIIQPVLPFFPRLEAFQNCIEQNQSTFLQHTAYPLSAKLTELIYQLLQVPFVASTRHFHISNLQAIITEQCTQLNAVLRQNPSFHWMI